MKLAPFPQQTLVIAEHQPQYENMPAYRDRNGRVVVCWTLTWRERFIVLFRGQVWQQTLTFNDPVQPQLLTVEKPDMPK